VPVAARNELAIYRASAGAGKTYTLVHRWLELALSSPDQFRRILALTFTNKATAEMKQRIVATVAALARGQVEGPAHPMLASLQQALPRVAIQPAAVKLLALILHHYSWLEVKTIDRFFLGVVRSFARELQLELGAAVDLDTDRALDAAVDHLMARVGREPEVTDWLARFAVNKLGDDKGWRVERSLRQLGRELFTERGDALTTQAVSIESAAAMISALEAEIEAYRAQQRALGAEALQMIDAYSLTPDDFSQKSKGPGGYFVNLASKGNPDALNSYHQKALEGLAGWATAKSPHRRAIEAAAEGGLIRLLSESAQLRADAGPLVRAADAVRRMGYSLPLLTHLAQGLRAYREQEGVVLIADVAALLEGVLDGADTSFVYEKLGVRFQHILLDEFQDTSRRQWRNLRPLVTEALATGNSALIVGDAKQSIYRWRQGDARLLLQLEADFAPFHELVRHHQLDRNQRSGGHIVTFNNTFFALAAELIAVELSPEGQAWVLRSYGQALTQLPRADRAHQGGVSVELILPEDDQTFEELALGQLTQRIFRLQAEGWALADIAVLVRRNIEGQRVAEHLLSEAGGRIPVLSAESLKVATSPKAQVVLSAMQLIADPSDEVARAHVLRWLQRHLGLDEQEAEAQLKSVLATRRDRLAASLLELSAELQHALGLGPADAFLQRLDDALLDRERREGADVASFLAWWAQHGEKCSIVAPEGVQAVRIHTLHKAKGLEFPIVILPFVSWELTSKHTTTLWASSDHAPLNLVPQLPIPASASMPEPDDLFARERREEFEASLLDNINLLYVGLTRSEQQLVVFAKSPSGAPNSLRYAGDLVSRVLAQTTRWPSELLQQTGPGQFVYGSQSGPLIHTHLSAAHEQAGPADYPREPNPSARLRIRRRAADYDTWLNSQSASAVGGRQWGQLMHRTLQLMSTIDARHTAVATVLSEGWLSPEDAPELTKVLEALLASEAGSICFDPTWHARTEAELLDASGQLRRVDRVLFKDGIVRVIEFKTGTHRPEHHAQLKSYASLIGQIGHTQVEAYLIYLEPIALLSVA
jgi:ATP-dependent helicase/nuclease subunit A